LERFIEGTPKNKTVRHPVDIFHRMSSWEDHEEMIDDQYLMESINEDKFTIPLDEVAINGKFSDGWTLDDEEDLEEDK
jgi:hypothetical protein